MLLVLSLAACGGRSPLGPRCEWPYEPRLSIDSQDPAHQRHLRHDAEAAETIALRFADEREGIERAGNRQGAKEQCEAVLWEAIARVHQVTPKQVRQALRRQNDTPF
jgi:hypothetical protein